MNSWNTPRSGCARERVPASNAVPEAKLRTNASSLPVSFASTRSVTDMSFRLASEPRRLEEKSGVLRCAYELRRRYGGVSQGAGCAAAGLHGWRPTTAAAPAAPPVASRRRRVIPRSGERPWWEEAAEAAALRNNKGSAFRPETGKAVHPDLKACRPLSPVVAPRPPPHRQGRAIG